MNTHKKIAISAIAIASILSFFLYGISKDVTLLVAPLLILICCTQSVWTFSVLRRNGRGLAIPPAGIPLFLFWCYSAIMIPFSVIPYEAKISTIRLGVYIGVYWTISNVCSRFSQRKTLWITLLIFLVAAAIYSVIQQKVAPHLIFGIERYMVDYWKTGRLAGTYQSPNHIAHLFMMWIPFCLSFIFIPKIGVFLRIFCIYAIPVFGVLIYQTRSRAGFFGLVVSLAVAAFLFVFRKSWKLSLIALFVIVAVCVGCIKGLWEWSPKFRDRMQPVVEFAQYVYSGDVNHEEFNDFRPQTWRDSIVMVQDYPWFGVGPGNYGQTFPDYRTRCKFSKTETVHPHCEPLELITEYGVVGVVLCFFVGVSFLIPVFKLIVISERPRHAWPAIAFVSALAGTIVHGLFDFELRIFPNALMFAILAGCAVAPILAIKAKNKPRKVFPFIVFASTLIFSLWTIQVMSGAMLHARGDMLLLAKRWGRAGSFYDKAAKVDPQDWHAFLGLGQVYSNRRYYEIDHDKKAEWMQKEDDAFAKAHSLNVKKEEIVYGLGRVELARGNRDVGLDFLRQAANYKRFNDFYWRKLGIELRKAGLYDESFEAFDKAANLWGGYTRTVRRNVVWLYRHK